MEAQAAKRDLPRPDDPALAALCRRHRVRRLDLFGSAATGAFDPARSDLDFLVEFEELEPRAYARSYFGLRNDLVALFGCEVDLVTLPALKNPYFTRQVMAERRLLFEAA